ncbi:hypothetical protein BH20ACT11_BH20ACT11_13870 [soil metagenome]
MEAKSTTVTTVSEIHAYPLRPEGYAEPLFHDSKSRKEILEHFARSGWLSRASEAPEIPKVTEVTEVTEVCSAPGSARASLVASSRGRAEMEESRILASWREVDRWWEPDGGVDVIWRLVESGRGKQEMRAEPVGRGSSGTSGAVGAVSADKAA